MSNEFTTVKIPVGTDYTVFVGDKKQVRQNTTESVLLKDSNGAICGVFNTEAEANEAIKHVAANLSAGKIPARFLSRSNPPPHRRKQRTNNRQSFNKNRTQRPRS